MWSEFLICSKFVSKQVPIKPLWGALQLHNRQPHLCGVLQFAIHIHCSIVTADFNLVKAFILTGNKMSPAQNIQWMKWLNIYASVSICPAPCCFAKHCHWRERSKFHQSSLFSPSRLICDKINKHQKRKRSEIGTVGAPACSFDTECGSNLSWRPDTLPALSTKHPSVCQEK